ncbi:MAG TPA: response regulator [Gemmatimonadales bacterium]|nr:response regulator [Gemmatimonadales bacterium]
MARAVLIVDDDEAIRTALAELVEESGFLVLTARNGQEALSLLERSPESPCVILLDLMMPIMTGVDFLVRQRADARWRRIPVIVLSAYMHLWRDEVRDVEHVLTKPVNPDELIKMVAHYCG